MEATLPGTDIPCHDKWEDLLLENDYILTFQFAINRYYVAAEKVYLRYNFSKINQFIEQNQIAKMQMEFIKFA